MLDDYRKKGLDETSRAIADGLARLGLTGSTVLELGCGFGGLTLELLRRGASSAVGVDLSPKMIQLAEALSREAGLSGLVSFQLGDGAVKELVKSEVVILDAVICCYPDVSSLVGNSSSAARRYYAFSVPDDSRLAVKLLRPLLPLQRLLRRKGFKFFIHPTQKIMRLLEAKGFELTSKSPAGRIWSVYVFSAPRQ